MKNPTTQEILGQVHAEEHLVNCREYLEMALRELRKATFNTKHNHAQLNKTDLHALFLQAAELAAILETEEAKAVRS